MGTDFDTCDYCDEYSSIVYSEVLTSGKSKVYAAVCDSHNMRFLRAARKDTRKLKSNLRANREERAKLNLLKGVLNA